MKENEINITDHALERFTERILKMGGDLPKKPVKVIRAMVKRAVPENMSSGHRVQRLLANNYKVTDYLVCDGWRIVMASNSIVTIERVNPEQN